MGRVGRQAAVSGGGRLLPDSREHTQVSLSREAWDAWGGVWARGRGLHGKANRWRCFRGEGGGSRGKHQHRLSVRTLHPCLPSFTASLNVGTHPHAHIPAPWGGTVCEADPSSVHECITLSLNTQTPQKHAQPGTWKTTRRKRQVQK